MAKHQLHPNVKKDLNLARQWRVHQASQRPAEATLFRWGGTNNDSELGRLKALSRLTILVRFLKGIQEQNQNQLKRLEAILKEDPIHDLWIESRTKSLIATFSAIWKEHFLKDKIAQLSRQRETVGLSIDRYSWKVREQCKKIFKTRKAEFAKTHGFLHRLHKSCPTLENTIKKKADAVIAELRKENRPCFEREIKEKYHAKLKASWYKSACTRYIEAYLKGNSLPLAFALAIAEKDQQHEDNFKALKKEWGLNLSNGDCVSILSGNEKQAATLVKEIDLNQKSPLTDAWRAQEKEARAQFKTQLDACRRLEAAFQALRFNTQSDIKKPDEASTWVPAVSDTLNLSGNRCRFVYGGVSLLPEVKQYRGNDRTAQNIRQRIRNHPYVVRVDTQTLVRQRDTFARDLATQPLHRNVKKDPNLARQWRVHQASQRPAQPTLFRWGMSEEARRRGNNQSASNNSRGRTKEKAYGNRNNAAGGSGGGSRSPSPTGAAKNDHKYHVKPDKLEAFPDAKSVKGKTPVQKGGGIRPRWVDRKGFIYEWDYQHGTVEKYTKHGVHKGEYCPKTGRELKPPDPSRNIKKYL